ncbi:MAG: ketopantoate hydroxymethyltransferase [uncultured bacterium]|nr:MAG: ketopantoate hydroxymethyltransferase [uncultured bacterium]
MSSQILGMNARNLLYIHPSNKRRAIRIADSKLKTKLVLENADIPTPKLLGVIKNTKQLEKFDWQSLPESFALKPNGGMGGEGIVVITKKSQDETGEAIWLDTDGQKWTKESFKKHIMNILDGNFSLHNTPDIAFFEKKLLIHKSFRKFTYKGVPDIRVIVYNNIPIMAMVRLPTKWSSGKANMMQGAVGVGIDMASGVTTSSSIKKPIRKFISKHPDTAQDLEGFEVPYWDEILETSIRCQKITGIGYLGVDVAIDEKNGPMIFELNARPGLEIQNVNRAPLATRLRRVEGLEVNSVEKGVRLAKELFGGRFKKREEDISRKTVIGTTEQIDIISPDGSRSRVLAKIDTGAGLSSIYTDLSEKLGLKKMNESITIKKPTGKTKRPLVELTFSVGGEKIATKASLIERDQAKYPVILGRRDTKNFLIDPSKKEEPTTTKNKKIDYKKIDEIITNTNKKLPHLSHLVPINFNEERKKFFKEKNYNPQFTYEAPFANDLDLLRTRLEKIKLDNSVLGKIFDKKKSEVQKKIELIQSIGKEDFTKKSIALHGEPSDELIEYASGNFENKNISKKVESFLSFGETLKIIKNKLDDTGIKYKLVTANELPARIKITTTEKITLINIRNDVKFKKNDLLGTLAHEIDTHLFRHENGKLQPYKIFSEGFAEYQTTEEGLAVYNKERNYKNPRKFDTKALNVLAIKDALTESFCDVYKNLRKLGVLPKTAFGITYKTKRGLSDTSKAGAFTKNYIYLKGKLMIDEFIKNGGDLRKLYIGKIGIGDLVGVSKMEGIKKAKYLPDWLKDKK